MNLERRFQALGKAVENQQESTALIKKIIQEISQSSVFSRLQEKLREG